MAARRCRSPSGAEFDLVITDVNMPVMDGLTLVKHLRNLPNYKGVPLLVLTDGSRRPSASWRKGSRSGQRAGS